jgi:hypothetical protein
MTDAFTIDDLTIIPEKYGADAYTKISYPLRYGAYGEIRNRTYTFQFNLNGEIKTIHGRGEGWLDAAEWLKRTPGNDWVYFSAGGYTGAYDFTGEYYVPCLPYPTNAVYGIDQFKGNAVKKAFSAYERLREKLAVIETAGLPNRTAAFLERIKKMSPERLADRANAFHDILGGVVTVLPPDARHVEYDVIPVNIADGCLYHCGFCRVKTRKGYRVRTKDQIADQMRQLKTFYGADIVNYNSVFLGEHDALFAGADLIDWTARQAFEIFEIRASHIKTPRLFLFGSVDSLLKAEDGLLKMINRLPFETHINIGLETGDKATLAMLQKPLTVEKIQAAFDKMMAVNRQFHKIEVTANFVWGQNLPDTHFPSILDLARNRLDHVHGKGVLYLSPLEDFGSKQDMLARFADFKIQCRLPAYIYLIQRL